MEAVATVDAVTATNEFLLTLVRKPFLADFTAHLPSRSCSCLLAAFPLADYYDDGDGEDDDDGERVEGIESLVIADLRN